MGILSLIFGIVSILVGVLSLGAFGVLGFVLGLIGMILGIIGREGRVSQPLSTLGLICSAIGIFLSLLMHMACVACCTGCSIIF